MHSSSVQSYVLQYQTIYPIKEHNSVPNQIPQKYYPQVLLTIALVFKTLQVTSITYVT